MENKNIEVIEATEECVEESKIKKFGSKIGTGLKKNWKKAATVAAIGGATVIGYVLGSRFSDVDYYEQDEEIEVDGDVVSDEITEE